MYPLINQVDPDIAFLVSFWKSIPMSIANGKEWRECMNYFVFKQSPYYHQMTLEELLFGKDGQCYVVNYNETNTRTYARESVTFPMSNKYDLYRLYSSLRTLLEDYKDVYEAEDLSVFYNTFTIPKKTHGVRRIDAPTGRLKDAQYVLKGILERAMTTDVHGVEFGATYHTAAFAYIKKRSPKKCLQKHQRNKSRWFAKFDFSNFFGSTTPEFLFNQLSMIAPFCFFGKRSMYMDMLHDALRIAFLNGGLPQGTPLSPLLTNIMMIPIDYTLQNALRDYNKQTYVYTRYADDIQVSSEYNFDFREVKNLIAQTLRDFNAPFEIKEEKTRYGSCAGSNWNLGMMYNKDCQITVGYRAKRQLKAMLTNYIQDKKSGTYWDLGEVQGLNGTLSHYRNIEGDAILEIVNALSDKFGADILWHIKQDLKGIRVPA